MIGEAELLEIMKGYETVEPKSPTFERMAETIRVLWRVYRVAETHTSNCSILEDGLHAAVDEVHALLPAVHIPDRRQAPEQNAE